LICSALQRNAATLERFGTLFVMSYDQFLFPFYLFSIFSFFLDFMTVIA